MNKEKKSKILTKLILLTIVVLFLLFSNVISFSGQGLLLQYPNFTLFFLFINSYQFYTISIIIGFIFLVYLMAKGD